MLHPINKPTESPAAVANPGSGIKSYGGIELRFELRRDDFKDAVPVHALPN